MRPARTLTPTQTLTPTPTLTLNLTLTVTLTCTLPGSFTEDQANALQKTLTGMVIDNADSCRIKTLGDEDDETYLHDIDEKQRDDPQPHVMAHA